MKLFENYTPQQLVDAIQIELLKWDDVKLAAKIAIKRLNSNHNYYEEMAKEDMQKAKNKILQYIENNKQHVKGYNPKEYAIGIQVEMEHTDDPAEACKIARDHLNETDNYYTRHIKSGLVDEDLNLTDKIIEILKSKKMEKAIYKIADNIYYDMRKARITKYIRKLVMGGGKVRYIYKEDFKSPFKALLDIFSFSKDKIKEDYNTHQIKDKYDVDEKSFASHLLEYFSNRKKWDELFSSKTESKKTITGEQKAIIKTDTKPKTEKKEGFSFNKNLMKEIYNIYNKKTSEVKNEQRKPADVSTNNVGKSSPESRVRTAREDITVKPTKKFISENLGRNLNQYQKDFINLACENFFDKNFPAMYNMDGTGAGKARQTIGLAQVYLEKKSDKPILIVTENKRIIESAFMPDASTLGVDIFHAQNGNEIKSNSIYITTYNRLKEFQNNKFGLVLFDEAHNMKNKSAQTENGEKIIDNSDNTALFSATPLDKGNQIGYIAKAFKLKKTPLMKALGYDLENQWTGRENIKVWKAQVSAEEIANRIDAMFTNLTKEGMAVKREIPLENLEAKITNIKLTDEQRSKYNQVEQDFFKAIARNPKEKASGLMKLRRFTEELKIDHTVNQIENDLKNKKQVVLFATRVNDSEVYGEDSLGTLKEISKRLTEKGIDHVNVFASNKQAKTNIEKFQNGDVKVILTTPESGGTGLSLDDTTGNNPRKAIVMTPPFSAMDFIQMAGRINRLNTKSKAEIEMFSTETMVDGWNKDIIANKLLTLGSAVSGDYKKLDIKELDRLQFMSNEDQRQYMKEKKADNQKVSYQEDRQIVLNDFKYDDNKSKTGSDKEQKTPKYPLRNISAYETFVPQNMDDEWPDAEINFGKYKGETLSGLQKKDPGYLRWALGTFSSKASNKVGSIKFYETMTKAFLIKIGENTYLRYGELEKAKGSTKYIKRIPNPKGKGYIYFYNEQQVKEYNEKGILPEKDKKDKKPMQPKDKEVIKNALKKIANIFAEMFSGKDPVQPTGQAIEQTGENIKDKAKNNTKKEEVKPEKK
jgi:superfamily II DNA or RNA helicase